MRYEILSPEMRQQYDRIRDAAQNSQWEDLFEGAGAMVKSLAEVGVVSGYVHWLRGVAADYTGRHQIAASEMELAMNTDPLNADYRKSEGVVYANIQKVLLETSPSDWERQVMYYELLVAAGRADNDSHLMGALALIELKQLDRAQRIAEAVNVLCLRLQLAFRVRAAIARIRGDEPLALEIEGTARAAATPADRAAA